MWKNAREKYYYYLAIFVHKSRGIRVNAVTPGPIWTPLKVASVFVFPASEDANYVTGHIYGVTGGIDMDA